MLTFDQWCYESDVETEWQTLHDEYGDALPLLSEYKNQKYGEYVLTFSKETDIL
jgi:hypothetical protein